MLRLLTFVVCDNVVIDKQESPSIVRVWQKVMLEKFADSHGEALPTADAIAPQFWNVLTIWDHDVEDVGKEYVQRSQIIMPDGSINSLIKADLPFGVKDDFVINHLKILGFPVGQLGTIKVKIWIESLDGNVIYDPVFYPIKVQNKDI